MVILYFYFLINQETIYNAHCLEIICLIQNRYNFIMRSQPRQISGLSFFYGNLTEGYSPSLLGRFLILTNKTIVWDSGTVVRSQALLPSAFVAVAEILNTVPRIPVGSYEGERAGRTGVCRLLS